MNKLKSKEFWKCVLVRCVHTVCQTAVGMIGTAVFIDEVNWVAVVSASALAGVLSVLKSIAVGIPEVDIKDVK